MTTQKENKRITPKGKALYPKLRAPDKFNEAAEPRYKISVQFDHEGTKYIKDLIQKELEKAKGSDKLKGKKYFKEIIMKRNLNVLPLLLHCLMPTVLFISDT